MKIIDKYTDFYDYFQHIYPDDTFTFDRRDSYLLTKDIICNNITLRRRCGPTKRYVDKPVYKFGLLQVGSKFWLLLFSVTGRSEYGDHPTDYTVELVTAWHNYNKPRKLIEFALIDFGIFTYQLQLDEGSHYGYYFDDLSHDAIMKNVDNLVNLIDTNDYAVVHKFDKYTLWVDQTPIEKHIPILSACGFSSIIDPFSIYSAFDEYFSLEKQAAEKIDADGTTNDDKIINHGFDTKVSFRGKVSKDDNA